MISTNDTTILAMLSRYPDISSDEADLHLLNIEHEDNRKICEVIIGRRSLNTLNYEQQKIYHEFMRWSRERTLRTRNNQIALRKRSKDNRLRDRMLRLRDEGKISEEVLLIYAISGPLPDFEFNTTQREKEIFWEQRVESNLGVSWREYLGSRANFMKIPVKKQKTNWSKEGF